MQIDGAMKESGEDLPTHQAGENVRAEHGASDRIFQAIALKFLIGLCHCRFIDYGTLLKQMLTKMDLKITNMQDKLTDLDIKFSGLKSKQSEIERDIKR